MAATTLEEGSPAPAPAAVVPETSAASSPPVAKFSRYRTVRRAQQAQQSQSPTSPVSVPAVPAVPAVPEVPEVPESADMPILPTSSLAKLVGRERDRHRAGEGKEKEEKTGVSRSMSRYHRRPATSHARPPVPTPTANATTSPPMPASTSRARALSAAHATPARTTPSEPVPRLPPNTSRSRSAEQHTAPLVEGRPVKEPSRAARDEAKMLLEKEEERQRRAHEKIKADKRAKIEAAQAEAEKEKREQARIEMEEKAAAAAAAAAKEAEEHKERLRAEQEAEEKLRRQKEEQERGRRLLKKKDVGEEAPAVRSPPTSPRRHGGGLGLFHRKRKEDVSTSPESAANTGKPRQTSDGVNRDISTIRPGGGGAVLGIDAPKSAINAGDRRVLVVCNKQEIFLPVTPTTTPLDLIKSASTCLTEPINVRTAVILESFQKVGLQRPLRNYEHVRDVMNSWDDDRQNDLLIVDSQAKDIDQDELLALRVPESKPEGMGCYIHYSSKPGKWSKRYFALNREGQLTMSKSEHAKDSENICHLSDFDIYSPTEKKLAKVKPPKKICYAVKSQQKSNIYLDETRFVHFFCTNDKAIASLFYKTLQGWRSWYLIHVMGEGQKKTKSPEMKPLNGLPGSRNVSSNSQETTSSSAHKRHSSAGSHYQLGSFAPLDLSADMFTKDSVDIGSADSLPKAGAAPPTKVDTHTMYARKMSTRTKGPPPLSYNLGGVSQDSAEQDKSSSQQLSKTTSQDSGSKSKRDTFAPEGLLGRKYSERQKALQEQEEKKSANSGPFTDGPSLINRADWNNASVGDSSVSRQKSVQGHHRRTSSDIQRSMSTRARPKPLVDLTPQYKEPPQHARKGKGYLPEDRSGPLVENATSPEEAIKIPSSTDWRSRPTTARPNHGTYGAGSYERTRSLRGRGEGLAAYTVNNHSGAPEDDSTAFTGGGLLAKAGFSQGHTPVGHGVMDGSKTRGPMLDMREETKFASGSLLAGVQRQNTKRQSVDLG